MPEGSATPGAPAESSGLGLPIWRAVAASEAPAGVEFDANAWRAQQADALVAIAKRYLEGGEAASSAAADRYQVVVHVDDSALRGGIGRADLPIDSVKRLACDGSVVTVTEAEDGTPLDVGRKQRTVSGLLRRALWARDRGCSFPGCDHKHYVDAHHIEHWADGGATSLDNLTLLCSHHHRLLHEGGFRIRRDADHRLYFERPDGRVIPQFGYRLADMRDGDEPSAERVMNPWFLAHRKRYSSARIHSALLGVYSLRQELRNVLGTLPGSLRACNRVHGLRRSTARADRGDR